MYYDKWYGENNQSGMLDICGLPALEDLTRRLHFLEVGLEEEEPEREGEEPGKWKEPCGERERTEMEAGVGLGSFSLNQEGHDVRWER